VLYSGAVRNKNNRLILLVNAVGGSAMRRFTFNIAGAGIALLSGALVLAGCNSSGSTRAYTGTVNHPGGPMATESYRPPGARADYAKGNPSGVRSGVVSVNRYAWRAALDAVSFMPLASSDPYGGAIATDWYIAQRSPNERLRVNILVGGPQLRGDTVRVTVFREERANPRANWVNAKVDPGTAQNLENVILQRARELEQRAGAH
jgi:hypothetical protein